MDKIIGISTALQAKLLESIGAEYCWVSGYGINTYLFGLPDVDSISYTEKLNAQKAIICASNLKSIVDIDNGIFNEFAFERYLSDLNTHSPYGICIEDEPHPKVSALYDRKITSMMDIDKFIFYINIIKNNCDSNIFVRTNGVVRNIEERIIIKNLYKIIEKTGVTNIILHGKDLDKIVKIKNHFPDEINLYLITSLLEKIDLLKLQECGFRGIILAHNLLFESILFQKSYLTKLLNEKNDLQQYCSLAKELINSLIAKEDIYGDNR